MHTKIVSMAAVLLVAGGIAGCASAPSTAPGASSLPSAAPTLDVQRNESGGITVEAAWAGPAAGADLDVTLDTHSVDLDAVDLADATLRNDRGDVLTPEPWTAPKGGHHRTGVLSFAGDSAAFFAGARWIQLTLVGLGDVPERVLRWEIAS